MNFLITPGSEVLLALSPPLSPRRVPSDSLHLANLSVPCSRQFSGQLTPSTVIIRSRFPNSAIHGPSTQSIRANGWKPSLSLLFLRQVRQRCTSCWIISTRDKKSRGTKTPRAERPLKRGPCSRAGSMQGLGAESGTDSLSTLPYPCALSKMPECLHSIAEMD